MFRCGCRAFLWKGSMDMSRKGREHAGMPFLPETKQTVPLRTHHFQKWKAGWRAFPHAFRKGSLTLEASLILPLFLCAVTALLYLFSFSASQARGYRSLMEKAELLALTLGQTSEADPYIRLYDHENAALPFKDLFHSETAAVRSASVRAWIGYTGETFLTETGGAFVYITPEGEVYHRSASCSYLMLTVRSVPADGLETARNKSGAKYMPCEYCVKHAGPESAVYITDYGTSYHNSRECRGLKRTVMAVPVTKADGRRCCSKCGGT